MGHGNTADGIDTGRGRRRGRTLRVGSPRHQTGVAVQVRSRGGNGAPAFESGTVVEHGEAFGVAGAPSCDRRIGGYISRRADQIAGQVGFARGGVRRHLPVGCTGFARSIRTTIDDAKPGVTAAADDQGDCERDREKRWMHATCDKQARDHLRGSRKCRESRTSEGRHHRFPRKQAPEGRPRPTRPRDGGAIAVAGAHRTRDWSVLAFRAMSTRQSTIDFLLDQLADLAGVHARKMFGEYALYCGDKVVALVCDNQLFVKITPPGKTLVGAGYREGEAYPGAKPSILVGADLIENSERLCELVRVTAGALPPPKPRKPGKRRRCDRLRRVV